uniref:PH01B031C15.9 protein n=1 Tax=Phyllostachys edulis TaxID=38705 RepID=L0P1T2_PHYED|nr:PH01B031C15.9 [Phyllostachys edulis]
MRNCHTPLLMLLESKLENLITGTSHVVEDPLIALIPKHPGNENDTLVCFLSSAPRLIKPSGQPMILKGMLPIRNWTPKTNLNYKASPNLRSDRATYQKMVDGLFMKPAKDANSLILHTATPQAISMKTLHFTGALAFQMASAQGNFVEPVKKAP